MAVRRKEQILAYVLEYEKEHGFCPDCRTVSEALRIKFQTAGTYLRQLRKEGRISECIQKDRKRAEPVARKFITLKEVREAEKKIKVGDAVLIRNHRTKSSEEQNGLVVRVKVLSKHKRVVCLSNNLSCTYTQLAKWYRDKRVAIE